MRFISFPLRTKYQSITLRDTRRAGPWPSPPHVPATVLFRASNAAVIYFTDPPTVRSFPDQHYDQIVRCKSRDGSESFAHGLQLIQVVCPVIHEPAPPLEQVRGPVGGLDRVADLVRQRRDP